MPPGAQEYALAAVDGVGVRAAVWRPENPRGTVALLNGRTEFIDHGPCDLDVFHQRALGYLDLQAARAEPGLSKDR